MKRATGTTGSLATGILRITLTVGAITVGAALIVTFVGSYRLAASQTRERIGAYVEEIQSEVRSRLSATATVFDNAAAPIARSRSGEVTSRVLASQYLGASELIDALVLISSDGRVIASYPAVDSDTPTSTFAFTRDLGATSTAFHCTFVSASHPPTLWLMRRVKLADGKWQILLGRVRTGFLRAAADRVASRGEQRSALVAQDGRAVISGAGGPALGLATADYGALSEGRPGQLQILAPSLGGMRGLWAPIPSLEGLRWQVLVAEPLQALFSSSLRASVPTLVVLLLGGGVAVALAWLVAQRLVSPLRELEAASYEAASGAYVPPLSPGRYDEVGRLADAFNAVALRLNALHDVAQLLAGASQLDQVLDAVIEAVGHLVGPGMVAVYLFDSSEQWFVLRRSSGAFNPPAGPILRTRSGPFAKALKTRAVQRPEPDALPARGWDLDQTPCRVLVAPLVAATEQLGVIVVVQHGRSDYTDAEVEMVRTFATQAAIGVTKSRLFEEESESRRIAESLRDVSEELVRPVPFSDALDAVSARVARGLDGTEMLFAFQDREALGLPPAADARLEQSILEVAALTVSSGGRGRIIGHGMLPPADELLGQLGAAEVIVARIEPEEPYGGALVVLAREPAFTPRDVELVDGVVKIVTLALDNAFLFERSRVRATNLETIFRISQAVGSSLQLKVVLNRVLDVVQMIFAADAVSLMTYDPVKRSVTTSMARGAISSDILHLEVEPGEDLPGRVFSRGRPVMLRDVQLSDMPLAAASADLGLRSLLAVPLLARGTAMGVLSVFSATPAAFDEEDMGLLQTFASQAALAIDTARLYSHEHEVAATLQRSILPEKPPAFAEIDAATAYEPAGEEAEIGGDYYDLFRAPDGRIVVAMADVCGKGVEAATKTSMIKYSVRAFVAAGLSASACLDEINSMVAAKGDPSDILTVWLGFLDPIAGRLVWANGGHPPGLLLRSASQDIVRLSTTGPLLGALQGVRFEAESAEVQAGDMLLLYTDGVTESRSGNRFFGEGRIRRVLRYGGSPSSVVERLLGALSRFSPEDLRDDVAIVAIRLRENEDPGSRDAPRASAEA